MKKLNGAETFEDRVWAYFLEPEHKVKLSKQEKEKIGRIEAAFILLRKHTMLDAAKIMTKGMKISRSTAYEDLRIAIRIYGDMTKASKEGRRMLLYEKAERVYHKAEEKGDLASMNKAVANMNKIAGFENEDPDLPDWEVVFNNININIGGKPSDFGLELPENVHQLIEAWNQKKRQIIKLDESTE
jgi:hypothetical protein